MSSSSKREIFNTRERAVSDDYNRLQSFLNADQAESLRDWMLSVTTDQNGSATLPSGITNPLTAMIVSGLMVRPQPGGISITIDEGVIVIQRPDATPDPDDSTAKVIIDPGQPTLGIMTLTPNVGAGRRIDIIECALVGEDGAGAGNGEVVIQSESRDIYNTTTGLFAPAVVPKVVALRLQFRIRVGSPGAGFLGGAAGWLPLAVASVPVGAATWNDVIMWDVRPLLSDLTYSTFKKTRGLPQRQNNRGYVGQTATTANDRYVVGQLESTFGPWRAGGTLYGNGACLSTPSAATNQFIDSNGYTGTNNAIVYLYALFPFTLPRWCRYEVDGDGNLPRGFNGILTLSSVGLASEAGSPISNVIPNFSLGLNAGAATTDGVALCPLIGSANITFSGSKPCYVFQAKINGEEVLCQRQFISGERNANSLSLSPNFATFSLVDDVDVPLLAKEILVFYYFDIDFGALGSPANVWPRFIVRGLSNNIDTVSPDCETDIVGTNVLFPTSATAGKLIGMIRIPLPARYPLAVPGTRRVDVSMGFDSGGSFGMNTGSMSVSDMRITLLGYRI